MRLIAKTLLVLLLLGGIARPDDQNTPKRTASVKKKVFILSGRMGTTQVWNMAEKSPTGEQQYTTDVFFDDEGGRRYGNKHVFCGNLRKGLGKYWFKLVRIRYRPTNYGCNELLSIAEVKEPPPKKSGAPPTRVW